MRAGGGGKWLRALRRKSVVWGCPDIELSRSVSISVCSSDEVSPDLHAAPRLDLIDACLKR